MESEILSLLWTSPTAMGAAAVQARVSGELAYTTVVTILSRLHDKGVLQRTRSGRSYVYAPVYDEAGLAARRMRQVLDKEGDRQAVLARFVSDLSTDDEALLRRLLEEGGS
ncbi:CopY family transcriptional regulator [Embleya scabrispora]|uniref:CopY family transcriptional regulator n=1 Tax=Embleya scabrispora TaxID=159449 RepID=A0A1T3P1K0_9ACTN|nr:CopY family transcriptional regulator [Embleya scabrispora]